MANDMMEAKSLDWDDVVSDDGNESLESVVLPAGNYPFEVIKMEKSFYDGSTKMPACNMAKVFLRIDGGDNGKGLCVENLYLLKKLDWKIANFLRAVGLKKHGEDVKIRELERSPGETGRCQIYVDEYEGNDGQTHKSNKIKRFYDKEEQAPKKEYKKGVF